MALAEMNKGRDLLAHASGTSGTALTAWAMTYVQLLNDYGKAITLRAGFWAHADSSKYTGSVTSFIKSSGRSPGFQAWAYPWKGRCRCGRAGACTRIAKT
jgi:hypothetical protein